LQHSEQLLVLFVLFVYFCLLQLEWNALFYHYRVTVILHSLGHVAPTWFMISVQLNLDQELKRIHVELRCTKLNSDQLIPFS